MKKLLVMAAAAALVVALAVPASAQYLVPWYPTWSDNFDWVVPGGNIAGNRGWVQCGGTVNASLRGSLAPTSDGVSGNKAALQPSGTRAVMKKDLRYLNYNNSSYYSGMVSAWIYDPYPTDSNGVLLTSQVDTRVGVLSDTGGWAIAGDGGYMTYALAAGITDTRGAYWTTYASSGFVVMNGGGTGGISTVTGYTLTTVGLDPAPRRPYAGWNEMLIAWYGDPVAGTMSADIYINIDWNDPRPNARLDAGSGVPRYNNLKRFVGLYVGSGNTFGTNAWVDDIAFYAPFPEPSSIVALGTGVLGLMGLILRRKHTR